MLMIVEALKFYVHNGSALMSIVLNVFLIFLTVKKSQTVLGAFEHLMIFISLNQILYSVIGVLVAPIIHPISNTFFIVTNCKYIAFSPLIKRLLTGAHCGLFGSSMAMFALHFFYRYLVINGSPWLSTFQSRKIFFWFAIPLAYGFTGGLIALHCFGPRDVTDRMIVTELLSQFNVSLGDVIYITPYLYNAEGAFYWPSVIGNAVDIFLIASSFTAVAFLGWGCYSGLRFLSSGNNISERNRRLQHQLYLALVFQTLIPVVSMQLPVFFMFLAAAIPLNIGKISEIITMIVFIYPAIDPLPTLLIVTSYKHATIRYARKLKKRVIAVFGFQKSVITVHTI